MPGLKDMNEGDKTNTEGFIGRELYDHNIGAYSKKHEKILTADLRDEADNAHHQYRILIVPEPPATSDQPQNVDVIQETLIKFQHGPLLEAGPNGITDQALLAIVLDRMRSFNNGAFRCRENSIAITKLEEAMLWMQKRFEDRRSRGVEGKREK